MPLKKLTRKSHSTFNKSERKKLLELFSTAYGPPQTELDYKNPFQLLIAVMLSAQSTDKKVNQITPALFKNFNDAKALSKAKIEDVQKLIREVNYYVTKSKHLIETAKLLVKNHNGVIPQTHEELIKLPGVGNKTANVIMSELGFGFALPVDTHVFRVSKRIGLAESNDRLIVEKELCSTFPEESWHDLHHWLIFHGRRVCIARSPKCGECTIAKLCHSYQSGDIK